MLDAEIVTQRLLINGLISAQDVVERGVEVIDAGRSNRVYLFCVGSQGGFIAKQGQATSREFLAGIARELDAYRIAARIPALKELMPRSYSIGLSEVLVTDFIDSEPAWRAEAHGHVTDLQLAACLGAALGLLHREPAEGRVSDVSDDYPWSLTLFDDVRKSFAWSFPEMRKVIEQSQRMPGFVDNLRYAGQLWRRHCMIHGDLKLDNCFIETPVPTGGGQCIKLIDWELAGLGDPAWDLAGALENFIIREVSGNSDMPPWQSESIWSNTVQGLSDSLLRSYAAEYPIMNDIALRLPYYVGVWMFQTALRYSSMSAEDQRLYRASAGPILAASEAIFANAEAIKSELMQANV